jgi:hypothetical protein
LNRLCYIILLILISGLIASGQERARLIQVTGIITDDEKKPVPHVSIISHKLKRGTVSEYTGIFSLISLPGDTVYISALGYKRQQIYVPQEVEGRLFKKDISLVTDTISIEGVTILPWRNYEEFKRDVIASIPKESQQVRNMYENLASIQASIANNQNYTVSPDAGFRMSMNQHVDKMVTKNQYPVNNLLNPIAWAKFFGGVKNGMLKNEKSTKSIKAKPKKKKQQSPPD